MKKALALTFVLVLLMPASLLLAPRPAHAQWAVFDLANTIQATISAIANPTTAEATTWQQLKASVLDPLARVLAQAVLKSITASVVDSINGKNGSPQFVKNLPGNLQSVSDRVGLSFIAQFTSTNNSPFAAAIGSALKTNYLQQTSLAGFFAANQCTLAKASPNPSRFVAGDWSQGGAAAWFALTTQDTNNPYAIYQATAGKLGSLANTAVTNQKQTIAQNNGFLSWCDSNDLSGGSAVPSTKNIQPPNIVIDNGTNSNQTSSCPSGTTVTANGCQGPSTCPAGYTPSADGASCNPSAAAAQVNQANVGKTCVNADGTPGTVTTPGSVIHDQLTKVVGSPIDDLISVHDFDQMVDTVLSALATKVVSTGLSALSSSGGGTNSSATQQITSSTDSNLSSIASSANSMAQTAITQLATYTSHWKTIQSAAQIASTNLQALASSCPMQTTNAQTALQTIVNPVLAQAQTAFTEASTTGALALQVEADTTALQNGNTGASGALTADTQALAVAPPSTTDLATAQANATESNAATSTPAGSLNVSGGTTIDQMNLLAKNAQTCSATSP